MKLYEFGPTRSIRARWILQELGVDFEAVRVAYTLDRAGEAQLLANFPTLRAYLERMYARPRAPQRIGELLRAMRSGAAA